MPVQPFVCSDSGSPACDTTCNLSRRHVSNTIERAPWWCNDETSRASHRYPFGRSPISRWAPIPLRLIVGLGFLQHGFAKLSRGPDAFAGILQALAVPAPRLMAWVSILTELLGGLAILLGAFVVLASVPMAVLLLTAIVTVHWPYGFSSIKLMAVTAAGAQFGPPGYECDLLYLACLAALVLGGPGPLWIDGLISKMWNTMHSSEIGA